MCTLYQDCALTSVRSQNDLKFPRKLINVTNISISAENRISKSVYMRFNEGTHEFFEFWECLLIVNLSNRSKPFKNTKDTQISGTSSPGAWEGRRGTYTLTHIEGLCRLGGGSDRIPIHLCGEGGSGGRQGEKEWWEGNRREREKLNGEKHGGGKGGRMKRGRGTRRA